MPKHKPSPGEKYVPIEPPTIAQAIALTCEPEDIITGEAALFNALSSRVEVPRTPTHGLFASGQLIAMKRKTGGGTMKELGIENGNEYNKLWASRDVYSDPGGQSV